MQAIESIPLFRTASMAMASKLAAPALETPDTPRIDEVTITAESILRSPLAELVELLERKLIRHWRKSERLRAQELSKALDLWRIPAFQASLESALSVVKDMLAASVGDLTSYIGQTVDGPTWAALQAECNRRYGGVWTLYAHAVGDAYLVYRIHVKPR